MPSTTTGETHEPFDGHAAVQIDGGLGAENAIALPAPHGRPFFRVVFHARTLRPKEGDAPIGEFPRGESIARTNPSSDLRRSGSSTPVTFGFAFERNCHTAFSFPWLILLAL